MFGNDLKDLYFNRQSDESFEKNIDLIINSFLDQNLLTYINKLIDIIESIMISEQNKVRSEIFKELKSFVLDKYIHSIISITEELKYTKQKLDVFEVSFNRMIRKKKGGNFLKLIESNYKDYFNQRIPINNTDNYLDTRNIIHQLTENDLIINTKKGVTTNTYEGETNVIDNHNDAPKKKGYTSSKFGNIDNFNYNFNIFKNFKDNRIYESISGNKHLRFYSYNSKIDNETDIPSAKKKIKKNNHLNLLEGNLLIKKPPYYDINYDNNSTAEIAKILPKKNRNCINI